MLILNNVSFTGEILGIQEQGTGLLLFLQQNVAGKFDTVLAAYIVPALKDSFLKSGIAVGDTVNIIDAEMYEKDNVARLRIKKPSQLPEKVVLNQILLSGKILQIEEEEMSLSITIEQIVGGKLPTLFNIFVPGSLREAIDEKELRVNDKIVINGGTIYSKDSVIRIRISEPNQLQKPAEDFYLGNEEAKDKFI